MKKLTEEELLFVSSLAVEGEPNPITSHALRRLRSRRPDVAFEESVLDVVEAWASGIDLQTDQFHKELLRGIVKNYNFSRFKYVLYKGFIYVFTLDRVLVTMFPAREKEQNA